MQPVGYTNIFSGTHLQNMTQVMFFLNVTRI